MPKKTGESLRVAPLIEIEMDASLLSESGKGVKRLRTPEEEARKWWLVTTAAVLGALALGVVIGRFLLN